jgi:hypothetical protein
LSAARSATSRSAPPPEAGPAARGEALDLPANAWARVEDGAQILLFEDVGFQIVLGDDGGLARQAGEQRRLAEDLAGSEPRRLPPRAHDPGRAAGDQKELLAGLAGAQDGLAGGHAPARQPLRDLAQPARGQGPEQRSAAQECADPGRVVPPDIGGDPTVDQRDQPVGALDDARIVRHHEDRGAVFGRGLLEQIEDLEGRGPVECRGRLVGEDQPGTVDEGARDRHALRFAGRKRARLAVDPVGEAEPFENGDPAPPHLARRAGADLHRHLDVLVGRQRVEQVVRLEDEPDVAPYRGQLAPAEMRQVAAQHLDLAALDRAQGADQRQEGGLAGAGGAAEDDALTRHNCHRDIEQDLVLRRAAAEGVVEAGDAHDDLFCRRRAGGAFTGIHQNTSAGSAATTRAIASAAARRHMPRVRARLTATMRGLVASGSNVSAPMRR